MKTKPAIDPNAAFPDKRRPPTDADLPVALGSAFTPLAKVLERLRSTHPDVLPEWTFSTRSGWHQVYSRRQRRIFYLIPKQRDYRISLLLGDKAIAALQAGPCANQMPALLKTAKRWPEGTAFSFDREACDAGLVMAFLDAKIAH